ncbi:flagellar hook-basal body complex protein [Candidatus Poribacteria bacterium]|nr:flagellar hook-basal body complex protein [Candidatus Poribacteria bacterium]
MIGSFISGLSGIKSNQTMLEVIGNNIANANTVGFKSSRTTFSDILSRTVQSATATRGPMQVGRGAQVAAITTLTQQGGLQETNRESDLAIQGRGYFIVSNGERDLFTRAGGFVIGESGHLVTLDGFRVQGYNATNGVIPPGAIRRDIKVPSEPIPPRATSLIGLSGNLDAATKVFATDINGRTLEIGGRDGVIGSALSGSIGLADNGATITVTGVATNFTTALTVGDRISIDGRLYSVDGITSDTELTLGRPTISGTMEVAANSNILLGTGTQFSRELRVGDTLTVDGQEVKIASIDSDSKITLATPATTAVAAGTPITFGTTAGIAAVSGGRAETTVLPARTTRLFEVPLNQFPVAQEETINVRVKNLTTGAQTVVSIQGNKTLADFESAVQAKGFTGYTLNDANFRLSKLDAANGAATSFRAIDSQGTTHTSVMTFFKTDVPNTWVWQMNIPDTTGLTQNPAAELGANSQGTIEFTEDGAIKSFKNSLGSEQFTLAFNANNNANPISIGLSLEAVQAMTQFNLKSDVGVSRNNGAFSGEFQSFAVERDGTLLGTFSNGDVKVVGRVAVADFVNATGLTRVGANLYANTENSGEAIVSIAGEGGFGSIVSGSLELSNVQIAEEFTQMILAQRGFQASANVITTTDSLMNEVINLKRG